MALIRNMYDSDSAAIQASSVHNQRIEVFWRTVNQVTCEARAYMDSLERELYIDPDDSASLVVTQVYFAE